MNREMISLFFLLCLFSFAVLAQAADENAALDRMIDHRKQSIERLKSYTHKNASDEIKELNARMIANEEKELDQMLQLRRKLYPGLKEPIAEDFATIRREFENELQRLQEETRRFFNRYGPGFTSGFKELDNYPRLEIKNTDKTYEIRAEIPGMTKDKIDVKVVGQDLVIKGERRVETKRESKDVSSSEFSYGEFSRSIHLEDKVDPSSMKTSYKDGILQVQLNKVKGRKGDRA